MNLYDLHDKPHELDHYKRSREIPQILVSGVKREIYSYGGIKDSTVKAIEDKEHILAKDADSAYHYYIAHHDKRGKRWPEAEPAMAKDGWVSLEYARSLGKRFPEGEDAIAKDPQQSLAYANEIIKGRWPIGEKAIATNALTALEYSIFLTHKPFPAGEDAIATDGYKSLEYAKLVLHGRFKNGEKAILELESAAHAAEYAIEVLGHRWPEAESIIFNSGSTHYINQYKREFDIKS